MSWDTSSSEAEVGEERAIFWLSLMARTVLSQFILFLFTKADGEVMKEFCIVGRTFDFFVYLDNFALFVEKIFT